MKTILLSFLVGCATDAMPEKHYTCDTWCGSDPATKVGYMADTVDDAMNQCFEDNGPTCAGGGLRKCMCTRDE